jgi:hypothetical protein
MTDSEHVSGENAGGRFSMQVLDNTNQQLPTMKVTSSHSCFPGGAALPEESRFEKFEAGRFVETVGYAHLGQKLRTMFPLPSESSGPEDLRLLVRKLEATLGKFPVPENS